MASSELGIIYRTAQTTPLTYDEVDGNFRKLEDAYIRLEQLLESGNNLHYGNNPPGNTNTMWFFKDPNSNIVRAYHWDSSESLWVSAHPIPFNDQRRILWPGKDEKLIAEIDGGDDEPAGKASGPFWEIDDAYQGRVPVGAGIAQSGGADIANATDWQSGVPQIDSVAVPIPIHRHGVGAFDDPTVPVQDSRNGFILVGTHDPASGKRGAETWTTKTPVPTATECGHAYLAYTQAGWDTSSISDKNDGNLWTTEGLRATCDDPDKDTNTLEQPGIGNYVLKRTDRIYYAYKQP